MAKYFFIAILFLFLFNGCSDDINNPDNDTNNNSELAQKIIGKWSSESYSITFYPDNIFTDYTIYSSMDLHFARKGVYEIKDSILYLKTTSWGSFDDNSMTNGISVVPHELEIKLEDNKLIMKYIEVFNRVEGTGDEIWGKWENTKWVFHKAMNNSNLIYYGRENHFYKFYKDSTKVTYGWYYLEECPFGDVEFKSNFTYSQSKLSIEGPAYYNIKVEFKHSKMYWYPEYPPITLQKGN